VSEAQVGAAADALPALLDGRRVRAADLVVRASDPGFLRGDGVFEVVRVYEGVAFAMDEHLVRLARSASLLHLPYDAEALERECRQLCELVGRRDALIRIVVTRRGVRMVIEEPMLEFPSAVRLAPIDHLVSPLMAGVKSLSYAANCHAKRVAEEAGYDDALLVTPRDGVVLECSFTSFACVRDGILRTPPLAVGILDSITRRVLIGVAPVREEVLRLADVDDATEACIVGTGMEVLPVSEIKGVGAFDVDGLVIADARRRVRERIAERLAAA